MTGALFLWGWLLAAPPGPPPPGVGPLLATVEQAIAAGDGPAALAAVEGWDGPAHPLVALARGHALSLAGRHPDAIAAYRAALAGQPDLREAGLGLIGALARAEDWAGLCAELPRWMHLADAEQRTVRLWLAAALGAGDMLLAEEVARRGLVRWPGDEQLRRGLAHALLATDRPRAAAAALRRLLDAHPDDAGLWQRLATADPTLARPALEAAVLVAPDDREARARLVTAQLAAGQTAAALRYAAPLASGPDRVLAVRAAVAAGDVDQAAAWLEGVADRTPEVRRLRARVALARGDRATARRELSALLAIGQTDVRIRLAALERAAGALDRAEALLRQAVAAADPGPAALHLAHLLIQRGQRGPARRVLRAQVARAPGDDAARALLDALEGS